MSALVMSMLYTTPHMKNEYLPAPKSVILSYAFNQDNKYIEQAQYLRSDIYRFFKTDETQV